MVKVIDKSELHNKPLLEIIEGRDPGAYFWIMPMNVIDVNKRTDVMDNHQTLESQLICVEEDIVDDFLYQIFRRHFDNDLPENANRDEEYAPEHYKSGIAFEWYLTDNFYTLKCMEEVLADIRQVSKQIQTDPKDSSLDFMRKNLEYELGWYSPGESELIEMSEDEAIKRAKENIPELIDFYDRFCKRMEVMINAAREGGYKLISVCGP